ncbi:hypothetical protein H7R52_02605 [Weissella confusa]|uniref:Uncharacterized protein n=1 Tax=Weissella confusa TaxID=1583 RepID=A0A923NFX2_WEICO|nr:hypothetical protein [Weissella confusa]
MGPDGEWYATLTDAQSANTTFDNTSNAGDSDAETQNFTVSGPDGTSYSTLSQAIAANSAYDNTDNTGSADSKPQTFTVNYVADMQWASLGVTSDSPVSAGSWLTATSDGSAQVFRVSYKADSQQARVTVGLESPISAGSVIDSAAGPTSGTIAFGTVTDSYLYTQGYH